MPTIRVLICSPVRLYGEGLVQLLSDDFEVLSAATDPSRWVAGAERATPDVLLVDLAHGETVEYVRALAQALDGARIVGLSVARDERTVVECVRAGVTAFVSPEATLEELRSAINGAADGQCPAPAWLVPMLLRRVAAGGNGADAATATLDRLTRREREVLTLVAEGLSNKQIGRRLCIELPTVKNHVHSILEKLEVSRRAEAVAQLRGW